MPVNLIDPSDISLFLSMQADGETGAELAGWLALALAKSLRRRETSASELLNCRQMRRTGCGGNGSTERFTAFHPMPSSRTRCATSATG